MTPGPSRDHGHLCNRWLRGDTTTVSTQHVSSRRAPGPWFRKQPTVTVAASAAMFLGVLLARLRVGDTSDALLILLVFPISLLALTFGTRIGLVAGLAAAGLIGLWSWIAGADLSLVGWLARIGPLLFLGVLIGDASDRLKHADEERHRLAIARLQHRQAVEVNDSLIQGMASAKWSLECAHPETALTTLEETMAAGQRLVSEALRAATATASDARELTAGENEADGSDR